MNIVARVGIIVSALVCSGCGSDTDKLTRNFEKKIKKLEFELTAAIRLNGAENLLKPLADKFGGNNCKTLVVNIDQVPYRLRREPNNMLAPYHAELHATVTILPCGHKIYVVDDWLSANEKHEWGWYPDVDMMLNLIKIHINSDAKTRSTIRRSPYEGT
jgi:hypothetical protein